MNRFFVFTNEQGRERDRRLVFFSVIFFAVLPGIVFAEVKSPLKPAVPDIFFNSNQKIVSHPVTVHISGSTEMSGSLILPSERISLIINSSDKKPIKEYKISEIRSIEFKKWKGRKVKKGAFVFYPSKTIICFFNGDLINYNRVINEFKRIKFKDTLSEIFLYSYYYDYRKDGKWLNSGFTDFNYPENNPIKGVVVKIIFKEKKTRKEAGTPLDIISEYLKMNPMLKQKGLDKIGGF